jgi:hypothetical protein
LKKVIGAAPERVTSPPGTPVGLVMAVRLYVVNGVPPESSRKMVLAGGGVVFESKRPWPLRVTAPWMVLRELSVLPRWSVSRPGPALTIRGPVVARALTRQVPPRG